MPRIIEPAGIGMVRYVEAYDRIGDVPVWAHNLKRRWQEEVVRQRVRVTAQEKILDLEVLAGVPPQIALNFLTEPGQRMIWQPWVTKVELKGAEGGTPRTGFCKPLHARRRRGHRRNP